MGEHMNKLTEAILYKPDGNQNDGKTTPVENPRFDKVESESSVRFLDNNSIRADDLDVKEKRALTKQFLELKCTFAGVKDPFEFMEKFEYIANCNGIPDGHKIQIFPLLLTDTASHWFKETIGFYEFYSLDRC